MERRMSDSLSFGRSAFRDGCLHLPRYAVEGRVYAAEGGRLRLINASEARRYSCNCPTCREPALRSYVDPSGARRNDVRMVHNVYVLQKYLADIVRRPQTLI
jgi:queuine/archaeosine tRNA-ribosyltransferase